MMGKAEIIDVALQLKASERYEIVEKIMQSLDKSDPEVDYVWAEETLHRAQACDDGRMKTISFEAVFGDK
jgi:putative addiction module component (TIGR02574 family)